MPDITVPSGHKERPPRLEEQALKRFSHIDALQSALLRRIIEIITGNGSFLTTDQRQEIDIMLYGLVTAVYEDMITSSHRHDFTWGTTRAGVFYMGCTDCGKLWKESYGTWIPWEIKLPSEEITRESSEEEIGDE